MINVSQKTVVSMVECLFIFQSFNVNVTGLLDIDYKFNFQFVSIFKVNNNYGSSSKYIRKVFQKTNISNPLIRTRTGAYQGVGNVSFSENLRMYLMDDPLCKITPATEPFISEAP